MVKLNLCALWLWRSLPTHKNRGLRSPDSAEGLKPCKSRVKLWLSHVTPTSACVAKSTSGLPLASTTAEPFPKGGINQLFLEWCA